jgi:CRP-like cAMP-binding protein
MASGETNQNDEATRLSARKVLRSRSPFAGCNDAQIDELLTSARRARYGQGESIIGQGHPGDSMFVLLEGSADVLVAADGHATRVASLGAGDCFGEMSLLNGEPRSATVVARRDCEVIEIGKVSVAEMLQKSPELLQSLSEILARRRIENEGLLAESARTRSLAETQKQYTATFLTKLKSFFQL